MNPTDADERALDLQVRIRTNQQEIDRTLKEFKKFQTEFNRFARESDVVERSLMNQARAVQADQIAHERARRELGQAAQAQRALKRETDAATRSIKAQAQAQGGGGTRQFLRRAGTELRNLPAMDTPLGVSTDVIGRMTAVVSQFNPVALAATAAGAGLALAVGEMRRGFTEAQDSIRRATADQQKYHELVVTGTRGMIEAELDALRVRRQIAELNLQHAAEEFAGAFEGTFSGHAVGNVLQALAAELGLAEAEFRTTRDSALEARDALQEVDREIAIYERALGSTEVATRTAAQAEEELASKRQAQTDQLIQTRMQAELEIAAGRLTGQALQDRIAALNREHMMILRIARAGELSDELLGRFTDRSAEITELLGIFSQELPAALARDALGVLGTLGEKAVDLEAQHQDRLAQVKSAGNAQIENAEQQLSKAREAMVKFDAEQARQRADADAEFMASELDRTRKFNKQLERDKEDSNRRLRQLGQDLENDILEAQISNSVDRFLAAQRSFEQASAKERDSLDVRTRRQLEDFNEESRRQGELHRQKLDELRIEGDARRAELQAELAERQTALEQIMQEIDQRVQAEKAAYKDSLQALVDELDSANRDMTSTIRAGFKVLESAGIDTFNNILGNLQRQARAMFSSQVISQSATTPALLGAARNTGILGQRRVTAFAAGTLDTRAIYGNRPALGLVNDTAADRSEAIIPYRRSEGLSAELARLGINSGPTVHISGLLSGATIGSGVTAQDLQALRDTVVSGVAMALHGLRTGVQP